MNKTDLTNKLSEHFGLTKTLSRNIINFILDEIKENVKNGKKVTLKKFGTFYKKEPRELEIYNPNIKNKIKTNIPAKLGFKSKYPL